MPIGETMNLAKTIAFGATLLALAASGALAGDAYEIYGIDENRDGVIDSTLVLEESDTLA
jgi:hypothetical protein